MPDHVITFARSARKELERLPSRSAQRILTAIEALAKNPRPTGCRKVEGASALWRIRIGDQRVLYSVNDRVHLVDIIAVRHRRDAYR